VTKDDISECGRPAERTIGYDLHSPP